MVTLPLNQYSEEKISRIFRLSVLPIFLKCANHIGQFVNWEYFLFILKQVQIKHVKHGHYFEIIWHWHQTPRSRASIFPLSFSSSVQLPYLPHWLCPSLYGASWKRIKVLFPWFYGAHVLKARIFLHSYITAIKLEHLALEQCYYVINSLFNVFEITPGMLVLKSCFLAGSGYIHSYHALAWVFSSFWSSSSLNGCIAFLCCFRCGHF